MNEHTYTQKELEKLVDDHAKIEEVAKSHLIKTDFYWIMGILIALNVTSFGATMNRLTAHIEADKVEFDQIKDRNTEFQVTYATISTNLVQIQKDIMDIKTGLKEHTLQ